MKVVPDATRFQQHIVVVLADLFDALDSGRPWSLVRCGDGEVQVLRHLHAPWRYWENQIVDDATATVLRASMQQALFEADWVGWHQDPWLMAAFEECSLLPPNFHTWRLAQSDWDAVRGERVLRPITHVDVEDEWGAMPHIFRRSTYAWVNLHMGLRRAFVERVLRHQTLFLAGSPMLRWHQQVLLPAGLGQNAVVWEGIQQPGTMAEALAIGEAFVASGARVGLFSLGVWAVALAAYAKRSGRVGIDWGHLPDHNLKPDEEAHWRYPLNTVTEDSPAGTMEWYRTCGGNFPSGTAGTCLPDDDWDCYPWSRRD